MPFHRSICSLVQQQWSCEEVNFSHVPVYSYSTLAGLAKASFDYLFTHTEADLITCASCKWIAACSKLTGTTDVQFWVRTSDAYDVKNSMELWVKLFEQARGLRSLLPISKKISKRSSDQRERISMKHLLSQFRLQKGCPASDSAETYPITGTGSAATSAVVVLR